MAVTCPWTALNELSAFESKRPRTKAEIVATTAIDTETTLFVSSVRLCCGTRHRTTAPANDPAKITANTRMATTNGVNIVRSASHCRRALPRARPQPQIIEQCWRNSV